MKSGHFSLLLAGSLCFAASPELPAQTYTFGTLVGDPTAVGIDEYGYPIGSYADGTNTAALFNTPFAIAVDAAGDLFVADSLNNAVRKATRVGGDWVVTTVAGGGPSSPGTTDGIGTIARFNIPQGIAADHAGVLYVADTFNYVIRKITPVGSDWVVSTIAGSPGVSGTNDGPGSTARFSTPFSVAVDSATNLYVADYTANTIRKLTLEGANWVVRTIAGASAEGSSDGTNTQARFKGPGSLAVDDAGKLYVSDWDNGTIRQVTPVGTNYVVKTIAGKAGEKAYVDGQGSVARFWAPLGGIGIDTSGKLYVTDAGMIRKLTPVDTNWHVTTIAGAFGQTGHTDGAGSTARFYWPLAVQADSDGNLYVADTFNHTLRMGAPSSTATPTLRIAQEGNQIVLSWPLSAADFQLESGAAVQGAEWTNLASGIVISGDSFVRTNSMAGEKVFYRLKSP